MTSILRCPGESQGGPYLVGLQQWYHKALIRHWLRVINPEHSPNNVIIYSIVRGQLPAVLSSGAKDKYRLFQWLYTNVRVCYTGSRCLNLYSRASWTISRHVMLLWSMSQLIVSNDQGMILYNTGIIKYSFVYSRLVNDGTFIHTEKARFWSFSKWWNITS